MRDAPVDEFIRKSLRAASRKNPGACADENRMAAYLEGNLTPEERSAFESHMADCVACQEVAAVCLKLQAEEESDFLAQVSAPPKKMLFRFSIPIPAIGVLLVCIAIGAVLFRWQEKRHESAIKEERVADLRSPVQPLALPSPEASTGPRELKAARIDAAVPEKRSKKATAEDGPISPPAAQSAPLPPFDGLESIGVSGSAGMLRKQEAEGRGSTESAKDAPQVPPESNRTNASAVAHDAMVVPPSAVPPTQPMSAVPTGTVSGAENAFQVQEAKGKADVSTPGPPADAIVLARTQEPFARPHLYAAQNRIATSMYETESVESSLRFAIKNLGSSLKQAESRKVGDRTFYKHLGYWIDAQCKDHPDSPIAEIPSEDPQYKAIVGKYPDVRSLLPASIFWEGKNCLLK